MTSQSSISWKEILPCRASHPSSPTLIVPRMGMSVNSLQVKAVRTSRTQVQQDSTTFIAIQCLHNHSLATIRNQRRLHPHSPDLLSPLRPPKNLLPHRRDRRNLPETSHPRLRHLRPLRHPGSPAVRIRRPLHPLKLHNRLRPPRRSLANRIPAVNLRHRGLRA